VLHLGHPLLLPMTIPAQAIGEHAYSLLSEGKEVRVLGRTSRAIFLEVNGEVIWLSLPGSAHHRRAIIVPRFPDWPSGSLLSVSGHFLKNDRGILLWRAKVWQDPRILGYGSNSSAVLRKFRSLTAPLFSLIQRELDEKWVSDFQEAVYEEDLFPVLERGLGMGPGLTPLADDVIGGALFAFSILSTRPKDIDQTFWEKVQERTTTLSVCLLSDFSQGYGPEPLYCFAQAILNGAEGNAKFWAAKVLKLGHTTGAGLLFGALSVWSAQAEKGEKHGGP